jgi:hypothetical protein
VSREIVPRLEGEYSFNTIRVVHRDEAPIFCGSSFPRVADKSRHKGVTTYKVHLITYSEQ